MDMNNLRSEIHVAQQSRRDKLRIHHAYNTNTMNQLTVGSLFCDDPSGFCSDINNFSELPEKNFSGEIPTTHRFNHPSDTVIHHDPQSYSSTWKSIDSKISTTTDNCWVVSANQTPFFVGSGHGLSGSSSPPPFKITNSDIPTLPTLDVKHNNLGYQEFPSRKHYGSDNHCSSSTFYHSTLQELVSTASVRSFVPVGSIQQKSSEETGHGSWVVNSGGDHSGLKCSDGSICRPDEGHQWNGELDHFAAAKSNSNTQTLSLSLSSIPSPIIHSTQIAERDNAVGLQSKDITGCSNAQVFRIPNYPRGNKISMETQALSTHRNPGPLGPFTGYATILRSSKFLRPAQILLEEPCSVVRPKNDEVCEGLDKILEEVRVSCDGEPGIKDPAGDSNGWIDSYRPENLEKKAKLLYMQDEVSKGYKQYHQQMQMVVSSFESVAGLGAATPYVSLALKTVSKHVRCLKNAIADQLKSIKNALKEDLLSSPSTGANNPSFHKQKGASNNSLRILEGQHIWRPQRGLPERAVSILRAWLFDHFLHPYPTDTDKHMLAAQTGLTRNQVSNWFINARVRVWKPMVEEIHMLETKGMAEPHHQADDRPGRTSKMPDNSYSSAEPDRSINSGARWNQEKRSRIEYHHVPTSLIDGSLVRFVPPHQTVSLTLGLRQSAENGQWPHYGGRVIRDHVA
ncbi:hypothetical protein OROHE_021291 [Orobanche hederae]